MNYSAFRSVTVGFLMRAALEVVARSGEAGRAGHWALTSSPGDGALPRSRITGSRQQRTALGQQEGRDGGSWSEITVM